MTAEACSTPCPVKFLSCLSGSDVTKEKPACPSCFLSCLSGSDGCDMPATLTDLFLSCLSGSDAAPPSSNRIGWFSELPIRQ